MLNRRRFAKLLGATALGGVAAPALIAPAMAQGTAAPATRGAYLIKDGALVTVDPALGVLPRADVLVRNGRIEQIGPNLAAAGAETIDATDMIVMPGFIDTHYHMWSALGRNFVGDGFGYFPAKNATSKLFEPGDFYNSVMLGLVELANAGITTVHNWSHNTRSPAHADAELRAHRDALLRARYAYGHIDQMPRNEPISFTDIDRVKREYFASGTAFEGLVHLGLNLRGLSQSDAPTFLADMAAALERKLPIALHASQAPPSSVDAVDFEKRGWLGPNLLLCHFVTARDIDAELMAKTKTPLSWATHSEFRLGRNGDPRVALLRMRKAGVVVSLSFDATSIAPPNMFENMRFTWNMGIPWRGTPTENDPPVGFREVIEASVVQSATPANVDTVMIDGRIVKRGGRLVAYDVDKIVREAKASALRIRTAAGGRLAPAGGR